jgi:rhamnulokinase
MDTQKERVYLAVDLGAESGRVVAGVHRHGTLELTEVHRFPNGPVNTPDGMRWDLTGLFEQIVLGLKTAAGRWGQSVVSIGVDTWGVDYGLLDKHGNLLGEPHHYRDDRTQGMQEAAFKAVPRREIYETTGIQFLPLNTLYQLMAESRHRPSSYQRADRLLFIPDAINYWLTGRMANELTIASTSQFLDARTRRWALPMLEKLGLRGDLLGDLIEPGQTLGPLSDDIASRTQLDKVDAVAVGAHDTASAIAAVPASGAGWAYLSSGTWSLMGIETKDPVINDLTYEHGFTNEAGVLGTVRLLKNIGGLWLLQECRRAWEKDGTSYTYADLVELADHAPPFSRILNPDDPAFAAPGGMPRRINEHLQTYHQQPCQNPAQMTRTIIESLALRYRQVLDTLERLMGQPINTLHIVGGGAQNRLLNQLTANATGRGVVTGPIEATAAGNILVQMVAAGDLADLADGRSMIARSFGMDRYQPKDADAWNAQFQRFEKIGFK